MKRIFTNRWFCFILTSLAGFYVDWQTKYWASTRLVPGSPFNVVDHYVQFFLIYNRGALWGLDPRRFMPWVPLNLFFFVFSIVAIIIIILYFKSIKESERLLGWGLALIMPGALGNLFDRIIHPQRGVVDFIKCGISDTFYWPIFNFADMYVTVGVGFILLGLVLEEFKKKSVIKKY
jgi:signal peptidase II